jgi:hypothetical protein
LLFPTGHPPGKAASSILSSLRDGPISTRLARRDGATRPYLLSDPYYWLLSCFDARRHRPLY